MMCSLFSVFDPMCSSFFFGFLMKWFSTFFFMFVCWRFWLSIVCYNLLVGLVFKFLKDLLNSIFMLNYKVYICMSASIFLILMFIGEFGMVPFVFTCSSHLAYNMSFSIPLWMSGLLFVVFNSFFKFLSHLTPLGCPMFLVPFLVLIETVSLLIRPFSLSIRLMANIMAGHMVMVLMSGLGILLSFNNCMVMPLLVFFIMFEFGVAVVQCYVFMSLVLMYWSESE